MGHYCVLALHTLVYFQAGEYMDIYLVLPKSYKRLTLSLPRVTLDFDYM